MPTRSALRTEVRRLLNDTNSIRFSDAQINTWLDMGNSDAITRLGPFDTAMQTGTLVGSDTFSSSEPNYQLNTNTIHLKELFVANEDDDEVRMEIITQEEMEARYGPKWTTNDISPNEPIVAYRVDYNVFGLFPRPSLASNGNTWRAYYYRVPSAFASDSDTPIFLDALHDCLAWYCVSRGHWQLGDREASDQALERYEKMIQRFYSVATTFANEMKGFRWDV